MAKKLLAILLAVIMVFTLGIPAFAADEEATEPELIPETEQIEGEVHISAKSEWVKAGKTASIPLSIISKVEPEAQPDIYFITIKVTLAGEAADNELAAITGFKFNENIKGFDKFRYVVNSVSSSGALTVAFVVNAEDTVNLFDQARLELGTVEVAVSEEFPGGSAEIQVVPSASMAKNAHSGDGFSDEFDTSEYGRKKGIEYLNYDEIDMYYESYGFEVDSDLIFDPAYCYQKMPWQDKIVITLKNWANSLLDFLITIFTVLQGLLADI